MREIDLQEFQWARGVSLNSDELERFRQAAPSIKIQPSRQSKGLYDLKPKQILGAVTVGDLHIRIRPKLAIRRLLFLLAYSFDPKYWRDYLASFGEADDLVEAIAFGFTHHLRRVLKHGLLQGYRSREDTIPGLRGRLRIEDQIRRHQGRFPPSEVRFDDFTEDIVENQVLRAALFSLRRLHIRSDSLRKNLFALEQAFGNVSRVWFHSDRLPMIRPTPLNRRYLPALDLAGRILRSTSFDLEGSDVEARSFMVDMNTLFEHFVNTAFREALGASVETFPPHNRNRGLKLDEGRKIPQYPDLAWWKGKELCFIGDAKYKITKKRGEREDLYQLLAYSVSADLPEAWLIYAEGPAEPVLHKIRHIGKILRVEALELDRKPQEILARIAEMAEAIKASSAPPSLVHERS